MATKDNLKLFSDYDGYGGSLTKKDMDDNLKMLGDAVDGVQTNLDNSVTTLENEIANAVYFSENADGVIVPKADGKSFSLSKKSPTGRPPRG